MMKLTYLVLVAAALGLASGQAAPPARPQLDPADRAEMMKLYDAAAFDRELNMLTRPLDAGAVAQLRRGMESGRPNVQVSALAILAIAVAQEALPAGEPAEGISAAVSSLATGDDPSASAASVRLHAQRLAWHMKVTSTMDPRERAAALAPLLEQRGADGPYYAYAAVDYLAELGPAGETILRGFVAEDEKRSIDPEIMGRAKLGVRKIELAREIESAGPADVVRTLATAARTPTRRQMDREFGKWVVGELAKHRPEAEAELRLMLADPQVTEDVQVAARLALTGKAKGIRWR